MSNAKKVVHHVDTQRDYRDAMIMEALSVAIGLIRDDDEPQNALSILLLARDRISTDLERIDLEQLEAAAEVSHA